MKETEHTCNRFRQITAIASVLQVDAGDELFIQGSAGARGYGRQRYVPAARRATARRRPSPPWRSSPGCRASSRPSPDTVLQRVQNCVNNTSILSSKISHRPRPPVPDDLEWQNSAKFVTKFMSIKSMCLRRLLFGFSILDSPVNDTRQC